MSSNAPTTAEVRPFPNAKVAPATEAPSAPVEPVTTAPVETPARKKRSVRSFLLPIIGVALLSAGAWYDSAAYDMSKFGVFASPRPGVTLPQVEAATDAVLAGVAANGVTADELDRSKSRMIADAVYAQDNQVSMARWYGTTLATGGTINDLKRWPDRIRAVTRDQVRAAAREWLEKKRSVTGYLVKDAGAPPEKKS
mgnify:CR=1 FL=1